MDLLTVTLMIAGLVLLVAGAEVLVRGASQLAGAVGLSPLVIGLTVVAFGTSAPEMAVSVKAAASDQAAIAVGNVVGSNIFNVLFILGVSAVIAPLVVSAQLVRLDVPVMVGASAAVWMMSMDGRIGRVEGLVLVGAFTAYTVVLVRLGWREQLAGGSDTSGTGEARKAEARAGAMLGQAGLIVAGLAMLVLGSRWLVDGAVALARVLAVSELVIGLTIVAAGTSLPEVATSILAALRGQRDIAVGNVVGSNIFNILGILGATGLIAGDGVQVSGDAASFDIPVMTAVAVACLPIFFTGWRIARWEGCLFLFYYAGYVGYLVASQTGHASAPAIGVAMLYFAVPLTAVTLLVLVWRAMRVRKES